MYRAMGNRNDPPENANGANLAGILWYLQNEVVGAGGDELGITRIVRFKVQSKATQPLYELTMNFGFLFAFDSGQCVGPWSCDEAWQRYGYFVGCKTTDELSSAYSSGVWYSLPGPCPQMTSAQKQSSNGIQCKNHQPGGHCQGTPTGSADCTYSVEPAGEISLDELTGSTGMSFWDSKDDPMRAQWRVEQAARLFLKHYPGTVLNVSDASQGEPSCDSNSDYFYRKSTPPKCNTATPGDPCYAEIQWAKTDGIYAHPEWYPGLTPLSSLSDFQMVAFKSGNDVCAQPCFGDR